jgi:hypothetical protein
LKAKACDRNIKNFPYFLFSEKHYGAEIQTDHLACLPGTGTGQAGRLPVIFFKILNRKLHFFEQQM